MFILIHAFPDRSGYEICGVVDDEIAAYAWFNASDETDVVEVELNKPQHWLSGLPSWRKNGRKT